MSGTDSLYERDFVAWAEQQSARLRAAAGEGWNLPIDWDSVAEEIEGLAKRDLRELRSRLQRVIEHVLKMQCSLAEHPRRGWAQTITEQRIQIEALLEQSPSLRARLHELLPKADEAAVRVVRQVLKTRLQSSRAAAAGGILDQRSGPLTLDQVLGDWFPPAADPNGGAH